MGFKVRDRPDGLLRQGGRGGAATVEPQTGPSQARPGEARPCARPAPGYAGENGLLWAKQQKKRVGQHTSDT